MTKIADIVTELNDAKAEDDEYAELTVAEVEYLLQRIESLEIGATQQRQHIGLLQRQHGESKRNMQAMLDTANAEVQTLKLQLAKLKKAK